MFYAKIEIIILLKGYKKSRRLRDRHGCRSCRVEWYMYRKIYEEECFWGMNVSDKLIKRLHGLTRRIRMLSGLAVNIKKYKVIYPGSLNILIRL